MFRRLAQATHQCGFTRRIYQKKQYDEFELQRGKLVYANRIVFNVQALNKRCDNNGKKNYFQLYQLEIISECKTKRYINVLWKKQICLCVVASKAGKDVISRRTKGRSSFFSMRRREWNTFRR